MQTVRQFDQYDTDILGHCQEHFSQVLRLNFYLVRLVADLAKFCNAIDKDLHFFTELSADVRIRHLGVLDDIVKKTGGNCLLVELQLCQNNSNAQRMNNIGFA